MVQQMELNRPNRKWIAVFTISTNNIPTRGIILDIKKALNSFLSFFFSQIVLFELGENRMNIV